MFGVIVMLYGMPTYRGVEVYTFDAFLEYVKKNKDVWRVVVPMTSYGYGSSFVDSANIAWLEDHYPRAIQLIEYNATISRDKFLKDEELQNIIAGLAEDYPLIDDGYHSTIEAAAHLEAWEQWAASEIDSDLEPEQIEDILRYVGSSYGEYVYTDSDGYTVYTVKKEIEQLQTLISELRENK